MTLGSAVQAHPRLLTTTPGANATVTRPTKIQLNFSEKLIGPMTAAEVSMTGMGGTGDHRLMPVTGLTSAMGANGKSLTLVSSKPLMAGTYKVTWHAVSVDTHRVKGSFTFKVK
ncbi:MAG: copper homeostasis periplasmic binding protein CopC [Alphaproteobacteria bacterium]|nr:copper homeostasis periplasmic binding protein CopC [Alphaproteobacteria bacterium]